MASQRIASVARTCLLLAAAAGCDGEGGGQGGEGGSGGRTSEASTTATGDATTTSTGGPDPCEGVVPVSFAAEVAPVFAQKCATTGCHTGATPDGSLSLATTVAHAETVEQATTGCGGDRVRVIPGNPAESYLWDKIQGTDLCGTSKKMPPPLEPGLTDAEKAAITAWICGGALND